MFDWIQQSNKNQTFYPYFAVSLILEPINKIKLSCGVSVFKRFPPAAKFLLSELPEKPSTSQHQMVVPEDPIFLRTYKLRNHKHFPKRGHTSTGRGQIIHSQTSSLSQQQRMDMLEGRLPYLWHQIVLITQCGTREKRSAHACLPCFRRMFAFEIIRDNKTN